MNFDFCSNSNIPFLSKEPFGKTVEMNLEHRSKYQLNVNHESERES
jgi:hypothetical protein